MPLILALKKKISNGRRQLTVSVLFWDSWRHDPHFRLRSGKSQKLAALLFCPSGWPPISVCEFLVNHASENGKMKSLVAYTYTCTYFISRLTKLKKEHNKRRVWKSILILKYFDNVSEILNREMKDKCLKILPSYTLLTF